MKRIRKPVTQKKYGPVRDPIFLGFVRERVCLFARDCDGVTEPHHFGRHGHGTKCSDFETVPLCTKHHHHWHQKGTLPDGDRSHWLERFRENALLMKEEHERSL